MLVCLPTLLGSRWGARPIHASPEPAGTPTLPPLQSVTGAPATFFRYTAERSREFTSATTCSGLVADAVTRLPLARVKVTEGPPVR